jgi:tetratricopeptide (TPR) repeat protein
MANIISTGKNKKFKVKNKKLIAALLLMAIGAVVAAAIYFDNNKKSAPTATDYEQAMNKESDEVESEYKNLKSGKYGDTQANYESELLKAGNNKEKALVRMDQSSLAYASSNVTEAERYALDAESLDPTELTAKQLAVLYVSMGSDEKALTYYKLALERLTADDDSGARRQNYEAAIRRIEG